MTNKNAQMRPHIVTENGVRTANGPGDTGFGNETFSKDHATNDTSADLLKLAAKLIDEAAYKLAQNRPGSESAQLFLIAASLENEIKRIAND